MKALKYVTSENPELRSRVRRLSEEPQGPVTSDWDPWSSCFSCFLHSLSPLVDRYCNCSSERLGDRPVFHLALLLALFSGHLSIVFIIS